MRTTSTNNTQKIDIPNLHPIELPVSHKESISMMMGGGSQAPVVLNEFLSSKYDNVKRVYARNNKSIDNSTDQKINEIIHKQNKKNIELNNYIRDFKSQMSNYSDNESKLAHAKYVELRTSNDEYILKINNILDTMHNHANQTI